MGNCEVENLDLDQDKSSQKTQGVKNREKIHAILWSLRVLCGYDWNTGFLSLS
jgi:hypothetical protein